MVNACRQLAAQSDYPLHPGVTEAGPAFQGTIEQAVAFGALLREGDGKGQIFVKGGIIKTVPEPRIVETLAEEALKIAEGMDDAGTPSGVPAVTVS